MIRTGRQSRAEVLKQESRRLGAVAVGRGGYCRVGKVAEAGAVTTVGGSRGRWTHGGVIARRADGQGPPPGPKPYSTAGGAMPVAVAARQRVREEMQPKGGKTVKGSGL